MIALGAGASFIPSGQRGATAPPLLAAGGVRREEFPSIR